MNVPFLVTCALPDELTPFVRRLSRRRNLGGDGHLIVGELIGRAENIAVLHTGMGPGQASRSLGEALERLRPECIIVSGTAGALRPEACVGDLLIASNHGDEGFGKNCSKSSMSSPQKIQRSGTNPSIRRIRSLPTPKPRESLPKTQEPLPWIWRAKVW
ncbi:hypothetical protein QQ054_19550 [Oscillatoria amoena NRMC-F 0135]|nr:hypothetical protein [Oscillatoria amoena NRMC-F 0135]